MHTSTLKGGGRLGNHIIRNIALSFVAKKHDLFVEYSFFDAIKKLGIPLHIGAKNHDNMLELNEDNFLKILNQKNLTSNVNCNEAFFQTQFVSDLIFKYLNENKKFIIDANPYKNYYKTNNSLFVHLRLGDICENNHNLPISYYENAINKIPYRKLFLSSDGLGHPIVVNLLNKFKNAEVFHESEIKTFQFASTCKNVILSHGSFSAFIGWLSFFSNVYYPSINLIPKEKIWYKEELFLNKGFKEIA